MGGARLGLVDGSQGGKVHMALGSKPKVVVDPSVEVVVVAGTAAARRGDARTAPDAHRDPDAGSGSARRLPQSRSKASAWCVPARNGADRWRPCRMPWGQGRGLTLAMWRAGPRGGAVVPSGPKGHMSAMHHHRPHAHARVAAWCECHWWWAVVRVSRVVLDVVHRHLPHPVRRGGTGGTSVTRCYPYSLCDPVMWVGPPARGVGPEPWWWYRGDGHLWVKVGVRRVVRGGGWFTVCVVWCWLGAAYYKTRGDIGGVRA